MADVLAMLDAEPNARVFLPRKDFLNGIAVHHAYTDEEMVSKYRLSRELVQHLVEGYKGSQWGRQTLRSHSVSDEVQILTALRYMAQGGMLDAVGELHGVSKATASRIVSKVSSYICTLAPDVIHMPRTRDALANCARQFYQYGGMPEVTSVLDGTHVRILAPKENEHAFVNRFSTHSLNVQVFCDSQLLFQDIVASFPGGNHDAFNLRVSDIYQEYDTGMYGNYMALGDSAYPLKQWLMTPLLNPANAAERRYNYHHKRTRCIVERAIGVWKSRFRCLHQTGGVMQLATRTCCNVILATAVLHNMCIRARLPDPDPVELAVHPAEPLEANWAQGHPGVRRRTEIVRRWFMRN